MNIPLRHLAVIMDGNGRWAQARGKPRLAGHRAGAETVGRVLGWCRDAGIRYLTLYAFSTENWRRSREEVEGLMGLLGVFLRSKGGELVRGRVRFRVIGRREDLSDSLVKRISSLERRTAAFDDCNLTLAVSYGGRAELANAARRYAQDCAAGLFDPAAPLPEDVFARYLYAPDLPDPDLVVRTSGEFRLSNFLLWQCAYAEFHSTPVLWPDFSKEDFDAALAAYSSRRRRLGGRP
jgi:undecaprenyl diphosphate synthase